ncbi:MAG: OmpA family protein [Pseudanabaena sp. ELA607]
MQTQSGNKFGIPEGNQPHPHPHHGSDAPQRVQLPSNLVDKAFGEVNVTTNDQEHLIEFTILVQPEGGFAEGWRTGLAIDGSASMKRVYGRKVSGRIHPEVLIEYIRAGKLKSSIEDGEPVRRIDRPTYEEIVRKGYTLKPTDNVLQPLVQSFTSYLAATIDGKGATALIYWGCGRGDEVEFIGEFEADACGDLKIEGPQGARLGKATHLVPAIRYFVENYGTAKRGLFIFLTDGRINDLAEVKQYTRHLANEIAQGRRNYCKFVLVGVGAEVDRYQLQELDNFDPQSPVDLWDYKIADEMDSLAQIFAEVVTDHQIVAPKGAIYDAQGNCLKVFQNGLPARVKFIMPITSPWFELEVNGQRLRQEVKIPAPLVPFSQKTLFDFEQLALAAAAPPTTPSNPPKPAKPTAPSNSSSLGPSKMQQAIAEVEASKTPVPIAPRGRALQLPKEWRRYALGFALLSLLLLGGGGILWWLVSWISKDAENSLEGQKRSQPAPSPAGIAPIRPPYVVPKLGYLAKKVPPLTPPASNAAKPEDTSNQDTNNNASNKENAAQGKLGSGTDDNVIANSLDFDGTSQGIPDAVTELEILPELIAEGLAMSETNQEVSRANNEVNSATSDSTTANSNPQNAPTQTSQTQSTKNQTGQNSVPQKPPIFNRNKLERGSIARVVNRSIENNTSNSTANSNSSSPAKSQTANAANPTAPTPKVSQKSIITSATTRSNNPSANSPVSGSPVTSNTATNKVNSSNQNSQSQSSQSNLLRVIVYFDLESSDIKPEEALKLKQFWQKINGLPNVNSGTISITGHTDAKGNNSFNIALSRARSEAVTRFLESEGMDRDRYRVVFEGKSSYLPAKSNDTSLGRAMNRRVELRFKP